MKSWKQQGLLLTLLGCLASSAFGDEVVAEWHDGQSSQIRSKAEGRRLLKEAHGLEGGWEVSGSLVSSPCILSSITQETFLTGQKLKLKLEGCGDGETATTKKRTLLATVFLSYPSTAPGNIGRKWPLYNGQQQLRLSPDAMTRNLSNLRLHMVYE